MPFLRESLTFIAGLLVLALLAALAGPWFIDWNSHRALIEKTLSEASGAPVSIAGNIDLKLLPTPQLILGDVRTVLKAGPRQDFFGDLRGGAAPPADTGEISVNVARLRLELGIAPLLRGRMQLIEASIDNPLVHVRLGDNGAIHLPRIPAGQSDQVAFEDVTVNSGKLTIEPQRGGRSVILGGINFQASGASLAGPFRGAGVYRLGDRTPTFYFNTGAIDGNALRFKFVSEAAGALPRAEIDGTIEVLEEAGGARRIKVDSQAKVSAGAPAIHRTNTTDQGGGTSAAGKQQQGAQERAWQAVGPLKIDTSGIVFAPVEFRAGASGQSLNGTGAFRYSFADNRAVASLSAPQIDLDRMAGVIVNPMDALAGAQRWLGALIEGELTGARAPVAIQFEVKSPALTLGGETLSGFSAVITPRGARGAHAKVSTGLPGRAHVAFDGELETGSAARFRGRLVAEAKDVERFAQWLSRGSSATARLSAAVPFRSLAVAGDVEISRSGFLSKELQITADRSRFNGLVSVLQNEPGARSRVTLNLLAPELDLDRLPDLGKPAAALANVDLALNFEARAVRLARVGAGMIDAGRFAIEARREGGTFELTRFDIENLGGASVSAKGTSGKAGSSFDLDLAATRMVEFADVLQRVAPGIWSNALRARAVALSPAKVKFSLISGPVAKTSSDSASWLAGLEALSIAGDVNGTRIAGGFDALRAGAGRRNARFSVENPQVHVLLRQIGLAALPAPAAGGGRIEISAREDKGGGYVSQLKGAVAGVEISFDGNTRSVLPQADVTGDFRLAGANLTPLLQSLSLAPSGSRQPAPADVRGQLRWRGENVSLGRLQGALAGARFTGDLGVGRAGVSAGSAGRQITGALQFERASLPAVASLVLGPMPELAAHVDGPVWPAVKFAPALLELPAARIAIHAGRFDLMGGLTGTAPGAEPSGSARSGSRARAVLQLAQGHVSLQEMEMDWAGGRLAGRFDARRNNETASLAGQLTYSGPVQAGPDIAGAGEARLEFAATGVTPAALAAGFSGKGRLDLKSLTLQSMAAGAVEKTVAAADNDKLNVTPQSVREGFAQALAGAAANLGPITFDITMAGGHLQLKQAQGGSAKFQIQDSGLMDLSAGYDLRTLTMTARAILKAQALPAGWTAAAPQASVIWKGTLPSPVRSVDVASLVNALGARAIEREAQRVELLELDLRERAAFNRRDKIRDFIQLRKMEVAVWEAEKAREALLLQQKIEQEIKQEIEQKARAAEEERKRNEAAARKAKARESARPPAPQSVPAPVPAPLVSAPAVPGPPTVRSPGAGRAVFVPARPLQLTPLPPLAQPAVPMPPARPSRAIPRDPAAAGQY